MSIFTRSLSDNLISLVKKIDGAVGSNDDQKMAAFVVYLTDDTAAAEAELKALAEKHSITNTPLTIVKASRSPRNYKINPDADVTVMMWRGLKVQVNHAFAAGDLSSKEIAQVVSDTKQILN